MTSADSTRVWGLDARRVHDLYWAARGVQVVRPGQPADPKGPQAFLLLRSQQGIFARAQPWLKRLAWAGSSALSVRIDDRSRLEYRERVISDNDGNVVRIQRIYPRQHGDGVSIARVVMTTDASLARTWAALTPDTERWSALKTGSLKDRRQTWAVWRAGGRLFDLSDANRRDEMLSLLVRTWKEPGRVIPGIYQFKPGVWMHESIRLPPEARLVAPLWIGASGDVRSRSPIIGPRIVADARRCEAPAGVDWEQLRLPTFPLVPRIRGGMSRRASKRAFDIAFSLGVLTMTAPIYPFLILAVLIEDGRPVFFGHRRQTIGGREFQCWKFRTMVKNAEQLKVALQGQNVCDGPQFYIVNDPRLLRVGAVMRKFQLDELPQFVNVLMGHMSVVGPRPSPDKENQFCPAWREARLSVRPGITGLWQVRRTRVAETDFQEWIRYDLEYVQHQSWRMDMWIIIRTIARILGR